MSYDMRENAHDELNNSLIRVFYFLIQVYIRLS